MSKLLLLAALAAPLVSAQRGASVNFYRSNSEHVGAYLSVDTPETFTDTCYVYGDDYEDYTTEPCERPCGYTSYSMNGYVSNDNDRTIELSVDYYNQCKNPGVSAYACASVMMPDAEWVREGNTATVVASATLRDCGYYSDDGEDGIENPLVGKKMEVDVTIKCRVLEKNQNFCINRDRGRSGSGTSRSLYASADCYVEGPVGKLVVDGVEKQWGSASFGTYKSHDVSVRIPGKRRLA